MRRDRTLAEQPEPTAEPHAADRTLAEQPEPTPEPPLGIGPKDALLDSDPPAGERGQRLSVRAV